MYCKLSTDLVVDILQMEIAYPIAKFTITIQCTAKLCPKFDLHIQIL